MTRLALPALVLVAVLGLSAAGSAQSDPFTGTWTSVDTRDNSNQRMTITRSGSAYSIDLFDDLASVCGSGSGTGKGTATRSGNVLSGLITLTCANGTVLADVPFKLTYRAASDTLIDGLGVVWNRVAPKPAPKPTTLPLGRLVLAASEAPGLKPRPVKPSAAKAALAGALRPARLPGFASTQAQIARYGKGATEVTSVAFVLKSAAAAKTAAQNIAKAGRGSRIALGSGGWTLRRKRTAVAWYRGRVLSAIVLEIGGQKPPVRAKVALDYGRVADSRVATALTRTALDVVMAGVTAKGELPRKTALGLFALAFKPLPGTVLPAGPAAPIQSGTPAARNILRLWKTLTPAQRTEAARLIGVNGVVIRGTRWTAGQRRRADYGDPNFTPDAGMTALAKQFATVYQQKTGVQLKLEIVAGPGSPEPGAAAYALPLDDQGAYTPKPTICRITMAPAGQKYGAAQQTRIVAHEAFHCMQFAMVGADSWVAGKFGDWVGQGTADWAAFKVTGVPWPLAWSYKTYLKTCESVPLYKRTDNSAVGFFGHTDDVAGDFWTLANSVVVAGFKYGTSIAYDAARGSEPIFLDTWPASTVNNPAFGSAWEMWSPLKPPYSERCASTPIVTTTKIDSDPYTSRTYRIEPVNYDDRELLHIKITHGRARISDAQFVDQTVDDDWFCLEGECKCPEGTEGTPPEAPSLARPAALGLTGGKGSGFGGVEYVSLEEFCKQKQPPPPAECVKDGQRLLSSTSSSHPCPPGTEPLPKPPFKQPGHEKKKDEPPDPVGCTGHGCAQSAADPHLLPFGGSWYDFQGVGEYTLVRSESGELEVQVRQEPWPGSDVVSMNTAAAMRVAGDRVAIYKGQPLAVRVNGRPVLLEATDVRLPKGGVIRPLSYGQIDVLWPDGTVVRVSPPTNIAIDLTVSLGPKWLGKVSGLLGDNDGKAADDFRTRSGKVLDAKVVQGKDKLAYRLRYRVFGDSWRVSPKGSLFDYASGQSTRAFTDRGFPARIATADQLSPAARRKAEKVCRRMGLVQKDVLAACILDVAQTGSFGFSTALALAQLSVRKGRAKPPPPPPPANKPLSATVTFQGKTFTITGAKSDEGCRFDFPGVAFRIAIGTYDTGDSRPIFILAVINGRRDGTYTSGTQGTVELKMGAQKVVALIENAKVTLAGTRTRGTFSGTASLPGGDPITGSFSCG